MQIRLAKSVVDALRATASADLSPTLRLVFDSELTHTGAHRVTQLSTSP